VSLWYAPMAWLGGDAVDTGVLIETEGETIARVTTGHAVPPGESHRCADIVIPGLANAHSHCFHRALRGRTERGGGTFWTWRAQMYDVAAQLTPDSYLALARATYAEMALAGITCVGEFHYVHHDANGVPYADPNAMGAALTQAAADAGVRITLLDTCYLTGGIGRPLEEAQRRFSDGDAEQWAARASRRTSAAHVRIGAAIHSVRAVPADQLAVVASWAAQRSAPLHVHVSEQRAENDECVAKYGRTPTHLLAENAVLSDLATLVHATHLTDDDVARIAGARARVCMCPTTERDLGDGIGPARTLSAAGATIVLGSDSHSVIDPFEEARALELDERLRSERRGHWRAAELLRAATSDGHRALGWPDAGRLEAGCRADFVSLDLGTPRTAGADIANALEFVVFAATSADVRDVIVGGRRVVADGAHQLVDDVAGGLRAAVAAVMG